MIKSRLDPTRVCSMLLGTGDHLCLPGPGQQLFQSHFEDFNDHGPMAIYLITYFALHHRNTGTSWTE